MQNPFEMIDARLSRIEALMHDLKQMYGSSPFTIDESRYGNFKWYLSETGEAESTARQRIARGDVSGVTKLGKRLLLDKAVVREWIKNNQRPTEAELGRLVEGVFDTRHRFHNNLGIAA